MAPNASSTRPGDGAARSLTTLWLLIAGGGLLHLMIFALSESVFDGWRWLNYPTHATLEMAASTLALFAAGLLLVRTSGAAERAQTRLYAASWAVLGLFGGAHAFTEAGQGFGWLHALAVVSSGLILASSFLSSTVALSYGLGVLMVTVVAASAAVASNPSWLATLVVSPSDGMVTTLGITMYTLGGGLLTLASVRLLWRGQATHCPQDLIVALPALLFGAAALMVPMAQPWGFAWWGWLVLRALAFVSVIVFLLRRLHCQLHQGVADASDAVVRSGDLEMLVAARTQALRAENAALTRLAGDLESLFNLSADAQSILHPDGRIVRVNDAYARIVGLPREELTGIDCTPFIHKDDMATATAAYQDTGDLITSVQRCGPPGGPYRVLEWRSVQSGGLFYNVGRDIAESQQLRHSLERSRDRLEQLLQLTGIGGWYLTIADDVIEWDGNMRRLFEVGEDFVPNNESIAPFFPGHWMLISSVTEAALLGKRDNWDLEVSLRRRSGERIWARSLGRVIFDAGKPVALSGSFQDITQQRQQRQWLEKGRLAAEEANQAKSQFLANMSHEIRTPMTGVLGMLDVLADEGLTPKQLDQLSIARDSARSLLSILNELLDLSKIDANEVALEALPFSPRDLMKKSQSLFATVALEKGVELRADCSPGVPPYLLGDGSRISQIVNNLLGNALRFTEAGSVVLAGSWSPVPGDPDNGTFVISVQDTGVGIEADVLPRLFDRFTQADESVTRRFGGTGLGLAICKGLAEAMGGNITAESTVGVGSRFDVFLPSACAEAPLSEDTGNGPAVPVTMERTPARELQLLVAEDNRVNQQVIGAFLKRLGHRFEMVENGQELLSALSKAPYDCVLTDIQMPVMDGLSATQIIRSMAGEIAQIPIFALTANVMVSDRERYQAAGIDRCLSKPIDIDELRSVLDEVVPVCGAQTHDSSAGAGSAMRR